MWNGKMKAVTLSYDDGVEYDIRLISILDRYGIRGTFNLNPDRQDNEHVSVKPPIIAHFIPLNELPQVYTGHEVAGHTCSHPHLENLDEAGIRDEIARCRDTLSRVFGRPIYGMAYPFGTYDARVLRIAREEGVLYARTCEQTYGFSLTENLLELPTTCRHAAPQLLTLAEEFVKLKPETPQLFYLWGHSYEFEQFANWDIIEDFCRIVGGRDDIFYGTNCEVLLDKKQVQTQWES